MNIRHFKTAIRQLPKEFNKHDASLLSFCFFKGQLYVCHPDSSDYIFSDGEWKKTLFRWSMT